MSSGGHGLDVAVERGIVTVRVTSGGFETDVARLAAQGLAQVRAFAGKGTRGLVIDLTVSGASGGASLASLADGMAPLLTSWEARGLPVAIVAARGRAKLEASRVVATASPRWGRVVESVEDAERWVGAR